MSRPLRVEYEGAVYHGTSHGNDRDRIFCTHIDRVQTGFGVRPLDLNPQKDLGDTLPATTASQSSHAPLYGMGSCATPASDLPANLRNM